MARFLLCLTWIMFVLTGCTTQVQTASEPEYTGSMQLLTGVNPADLVSLKALADLYNQEHPQNPVEIVNFNRQEDLIASFTEAFPQENPEIQISRPRIYLIDYRMLPSMAAAQSFWPLDELLQTSPILKAEDFYPTALDAYRWKNQQLCLPQGSASLVVYYNQSMFEKAGVAVPQANWGFDEFLAAARTLSSDVNGDGVIDQFGLGMQPGLATLAPFIWTKGVDIINDRSAPIKLSLDSPEAMEMLKWYTNLQVSHQVSPNFQQEELVDSTRRFILGNVAMLVAGRSATPALRTISSFTWDVAPLPVGLQPASLLESSGYCIVSNTAGSRPAWDFVEFAAGPVGQAITASSGSVVPALKSVADSPLFLQSEKLPASSRVWLDAQPFVKGFPVIPGWIEIEDAYTIQVTRMYYGQVGIEEALQAAAMNSAVFFLSK